MRWRHTRELENSRCCACFPLSWGRGPGWQKWNEATQQFDLNTFSGGAWSIPNMTLNPGEGVFVQPGSATTFTFIGEVPQGTLASPFPSGDSIRSSMVPQSGPIDTLLGLPLINNDVIY